MVSATLITELIAKKCRTIFSESGFFCGGFMFPLYKSIVLKTNKNIVDVVGVLQITSCFYGEVSKAGFKLRMVNNNRYFINAFKPVIIGVFDCRNNELNISAKMRPTVFATIFAMIWFSGVVLACIAMLFFLLKNESFEMEMLIPFVMLALGYCLTEFPFVVECENIEKLMLELINL